jgi:hypothetical protein
MGRQSIWEYFRSVYARYRQAAREMKRKMLDEFCANTGYNRKYALRLLNGPPPGRAGARPSGPARRRPTYGKELVSVLKAIWKAAGYPAWWKSLGWGDLSRFPGLGENRKVLGKRNGRRGRATLVKCRFRG